MYLIKNSYFTTINMLTKLDHPILGTKYFLVQKMTYIHSRYRMVIAKI